METDMGIFSDWANNAFGAYTFRDFISAAKIGDNGLIANYLQQSPDRINKQETMSGRNALMWAIAKGPAETVKLLLQKGASLRGQDVNGHNVLHMAVIIGAREKAELLLARADIRSIINEKNSREGGITALMYGAMIPEGADIVRRLLQAGADPDIADSKGRTALSFARERGHTGIVTVLEQWAGQSRLASRPKRGRYNI
jgi:ankyrin repeat protein